MNPNLASIKKELSHYLEQGSPVFDILRSDLKRSAVMILFYQKKGRTCILLGQKSKTLRQHQSQISFPGGKTDPSDSSLLMTAKRELKEEFGIDGKFGFEHLGYLPSIWTMTGYIVHPIVCCADQLEQIKLDHHEFQASIDFPVRELWNESIFKKNDIEVGGKSFEMYEFNYEGYRIWGATAHLLMVLKDRLSKITKTGTQKESLDPVRISK